MTSHSAAFSKAVARLLMQSLILEAKDVQDKLDAIEFEVWPSKSLEEFVKYVAGQLVLWTRLIKAARIKPE